MKSLSIKQSIESKKLTTQQGLTLWELMTSMAVLVVLYSVALPAFSQILQNARQGAAVEQLHNLLALARIESVTRRQQISVCRSFDAQLCAGAAKNGLSEGWPYALMFVDTERNRVFDPEQDRLLRVSSLPDIPVSWNRGDSLSYQPDGSLSGGSNGTFRVSTAQGDRVEALIVSLAGRVRRERNQIVAGELVLKP
ncbi:GspH/FimT family pseudopilin [Nitrincola sp. MINF-07-Sa-05]|uniref:GspH/FimT family pseudopilin n=1 Tax=Nitrincola salilacus TaxID=3400273 RepID=UPI0039182973